MSKILLTNGTEPSTPSPGKLSIYSDAADKHLKIKDENGLVSDFLDITPSVFGSDYQKSDSLTESSLTGNTNFGTKLTQTTPSIAAGTYRIGFTYDWGMSDKKDEFEARIVVDAGAASFTHVQKPVKNYDVTEHVDNLTSYFEIVLTAAVHTIDLDFKTSNATKTAYIKNARIERWRVI